jgi:hypothetical protein
MVSQSLFYSVVILFRRYSNSHSPTTAMTVSYRTVITIVQFIFFVPSAFYAIGLCFHYGLKAAGTWRFIATLSLLRVAGSISYFVSLSNPGLNVIVSVVVCELSGLAPLMLVCVALVGRV